MPVDGYQGRRDDVVELGVISRPHGVKGAVRVHPYNPDSLLLGERERLLLMKEGEEPRWLEVSGARRAPKVFILDLAGVTSREAADALRGAELGIPRSELPEVDEEEEFYLIDLIGLPVVGEGGFRGEVLAVLEYPSVDCLRVASEDGEREIPLMRPWVLDVDVEARRVEVGEVDDIPLLPRKGGAR